MAKFSARFVTSEVKINQPRCMQNGQSALTVWGLDLLKSQHAVKVPARARSRPDPPSGSRSTSDPIPSSIEIAKPSNASAVSSAFSKDSAFLRTEVGLWSVPTDRVPGPRETAYSRCLSTGTVAVAFASCPDYRDAARGESPTEI